MSFSSIFHPPTSNKDIYLTTFVSFHLQMQNLMRAQNHFIKTALLTNDETRMNVGKIERKIAVTCSCDIIAAQRWRITRNAHVPSISSIPKVLYPNFCVLITVWVWVMGDLFRWVWVYPSKKQWVLPKLWVWVLVYSNNGTCRNQNFISPTQLL